jgi:hypothetical protein
MAKSRMHQARYRPLLTSKMTPNKAPMQTTIRTAMIRSAGARPLQTDRQLRYLLGEGGFTLDPPLGGLAGADCVGAT